MELGPGFSLTCSQRQILIWLVELFIEANGDFATLPGGHQCVGFIDLLKREAMGDEI